ncbi:MAG: DNRLRE domain-containing protein, partial [Clostridia bacterium]|nr:DNRLRE domain-containing protein [Clostridia bacterium]
RMAIVNADYHSNVADTYVREGSSADNSRDQLLRVGVSSSKSYRAYVRIGSLPAIDASASVSSVSLSLSLASEPGKSREVFLGKASRGWNPATVSFANQPSFTKLAGAVTGASDSVCTFDIPEGLFEDFYAGNHFGYVIYSADESKSGTVSLCSSEYGSFGCRPVLTVRYGFEEGAAPSSRTLPDGTYYLNNAGTGTFLYFDGTPRAESGFIAELGDGVRWRLRGAGDGLYTLSPESAPGRYLEAPDADTLRLSQEYPDGAVPDSCRWNISVSAGGGVSVSRTDGSETYYLCSCGDSLCLITDRYTPEYEEFAQTAWRIADTGYYGNGPSSTLRELPSDAVMNSIESAIGSVIPAGAVSEPGNLCWATPDDFEFSFSDWDPVIYEDGCFYLDQYGGTKVEAFHKVTGKTFEFYILSGFSTTAGPTPTPAYITNGVNQAYDVWPASKESSFYEKDETERQLSLASIKLRAQITILGGMLLQNDDAAAMLNHYLENTGTLYDVGMKDMLAEWDTAQDYRARDIDCLMRAVEATATDSEQTLCTISQISCKVSEDTNWGRAVGSYTTSVSCVYRKTSESTY